MLSTTQSGLESGTYRLKSTFTLTSSSGSVETITIYSTEKKVGQSIKFNATLAKNITQYHEKGVR